MRIVLLLFLLARVAFAQESLIPPAITCRAGLTCVPNPLLGPGTISLTGAVVASDTVCSGTSDAGATATSEIASATAAGKSYFMPSRCRAGLGSPGAGGAVAIPAGASIICEDQTAGFFAVGLHCVGGRYPGAACTTPGADPQCLGGGTCAYDFGSTKFAPTPGTAYAMLKDIAGGANVSITNCTLWVYQADGYQRVNGGGNNGYPCRQECTGSGSAGLRCEANSDCGGGTCVNGSTPDDSPSGTCGAAPLSAVGPGKINPIDLSRTNSVTLRNVKIRDHFVGDFSIKTNYAALIEDTDTAADISDCTSPLTTPTDSNCFTGGAGQCCYGAQNFLSSNVQPATQVTNGIVVAGLRSKLLNVRARGSTLAISLGDGLIDNSEAIPASAAGPGTAGGGFSVGINSVISKARIPFLASGLTGIAVTGADSKVALSAVTPEGAGTGISVTAAGGYVEGNTITGTYATGILLGGARSTAIGNTVTGVQTTGVGISSTAANNKVVYNYIDGNGTNADGILLSAGAPQNIVQGNSVMSIPVNTLARGVTVRNTDRANVSGNYVHEVHDSAYWYQAGSGLRSIGNTSYLTTTRPTSALHPVHMRLDDGSVSGPTQSTVADSFHIGGWRGIVTNGRQGGGGGLMNTNFVGNRFFSLCGAAFAVGGAGTMIDGMYYNPSGGCSLGPGLTCDSSCTGGVGRGGLCFQDSDCTTCQAGVAACVPEPFVTFWGPSPTATMEAAHPSLTNSIVFAGGFPATKQCTGGTYPGAQCTTAGNSCAGASPTCTGGPPGICGGTTTEAGALCCVGGGTCTVRTDSAYIRVVDYGTAGNPNNGLSDGEFTANRIFPGVANANFHGLDFGMVNTGQLHAERIVFNSNVFMHANATNTSAIRFPLGGTYAGVTFSGNSFTGWGQDVENWIGTRGALAYVPRSTALVADQTLTSLTFTDVTASSIPVSVALDANRRYYFNCEPTFSSAALTTGVAFAVSYSGTFTTFTYISRLPTATIETGAGTDTMTEQEGNTNDDTATPSLGVGATGTKYMANVRGDIVTTTAGNLTLRVKRENTDGAIIVYAGSNCIVTQVP